MRKTLLKKLCCPFDKEELNVQVFKEVDEEIIEGVLSCAKCGRYYPIIYGIPIMSPDEYREKSMELPLLEKWGLEVTEDQKSFVLKGQTLKEIGN